MLKKTKIVATVGPSTIEKETLVKMIQEGVNVEASVFTDSDLNISATDFRKIIDQPSIENITPYIPNHLTESEIQEVLEVLLKLTEKLS